MTDAPSDKTATLPTRLRAAREAAGLSQGQVAQLMNMHRPTISEMDAGTRRITADDLATLAALYATTFSSLLVADPPRDPTADHQIKTDQRRLVPHYDRPHKI